jgi:hypothetical protein
MSTAGLLLHQSRLVRPIATAVVDMSSSGHNGLYASGRIGAALYQVATAGCYQIFYGQ